MCSSADEWVVGLIATSARHDGVHGISNRRTPIVDRSDLPEHPGSGNYCAQSILSRKPQSDFHSELFIRYFVAFSPIVGTQLSFRSKNST
jgi:hypothetical protein